MGEAVTEWLSLSEAALVRGVCAETIRNAATDGRISWRWGRSPTRQKQERREVYWPDVERYVFPGVGGGQGKASGPVQDATWARFCVVWDQVVQRMQEEGRG